jgi:hypothetical protein
LNHWGGQKSGHAHYENNFISLVLFCLAQLKLGTHPINNDLSFQKYLNSGKYFNLDLND